MIVYRVDDSYLEVEVTDLRSKTIIAGECEGVDVTGCKVVVIFVRETLDNARSHTKFPKEEHGRGSDLIDLFECSDPDHI